MGTKRRASSRLAMWQGKRKQGRRRAKIWIPKEKNSALGQNGGTRRGNRFQNQDMKYGVMPVKLEMIWGNPWYSTQNSKLKFKSELRAGGVNLSPKADM